MSKIFIFLGLSLCFLSSAYGGSFTCKGHVKIIALSPGNGTLQVDTGFGTHYLCKMHEPYNGVHPDICKAWYSMFLTAQASGREVSQTYSDKNGTNCSSLGTWVVPKPLPYYVKIEQ